MKKTAIFITAVLMSSGAFAQNASVDAAAAGIFDGGTSSTQSAAIEDLFPKRSLTTKGSINYDIIFQDHFQLGALNIYQRDLISNYEALVAGTLAGPVFLDTSTAGLIRNPHANLVGVELMELSDASRGLVAYVTSSIGIANYNGPNATLGIKLAGQISNSNMGADSNLPSPGVYDNDYPGEGNEVAGESYEKQPVIDLSSTVASYNIPVIYRVPAPADMVMDPSNVGFKTISASLVADFQPANF